MFGWNLELHGPRSSASTWATARRFEHGPRLHCRGPSWPPRVSGSEQQGGWTTATEANVACQTPKSGNSLDAVVNRAPAHREAEIHTIVLKTSADSARQARRIVTECLAMWGLVDSLQVTALLASEVVTNAVIHAPPYDPLVEFLLAIGHTGQVLRVEVADASTDPPTLGAGAVDRLTGRGLLLLDALSSDWGVEAGPSSKVVWFEVEV